MIIGPVELPRLDSNRLMRPLLLLPIVFACTSCGLLLLSGYTRVDKSLLNPEPVVSIFSSRELKIQESNLRNPITTPS